MKLKSGKIIFILLIAHSSLQIVNAQWQADVRLTNDPFASFTNTFYNNVWCVAASGDSVHVVWYDNRDGNYEIYYKRSTNGGISWGADTRLTNDTALSQYPSIAINNQMIHVVWQDKRNGDSLQVYYKRSTNGGVSWGADTRVSFIASASGYPCIASSGSVLHVLWSGYTFTQQIYYRRSTDGGASWSSETPLTTNPAIKGDAAISSSGSLVHIVWDDLRTGQNFVYYKRSTDGGINWGPDTRLPSFPSGNPSITSFGQIAHVVWMDGRDGNDEIYYNRSTDGGMSWGADTRLTFNSFNSRNPSISASGQAVHLVWRDDRDGNYEIYYKRSTDSGTSWEADTRLTNNSAFSGGPSVSASGQAVHVVWYDNRDGNAEIYYKRNPTGNLVGIKNINSEIPKEFYLSQNYPNPFNPATKIDFAIPVNGFVSIKVFDMLGREVAVIVNRDMIPGTYTADFDASKLSSGVYFYNLVSGNFVDTKKMVLIK